MYTNIIPSLPSHYYKIHSCDFRLFELLIIICYKYFRIAK